MLHSLKAKRLFSTLIAALAGACSKAPEYAVIQPFPTPVWAGPFQEDLRIKAEADGSGDLMLMTPNDYSQRQLRRFGAIPPNARDVLRPVYRYSRSGNKLVELPPEALTQTPGSLAVWQDQRLLSDLNELTHDLAKHILRFRGSPVPTAGPTVLAASMSLDGKYASCLSAEGPFRRGLMAFTDPVVSGKRFHQVFRMSDAVEVGKPVILSKTTEKDDIQPSWSPDSRYVVYMDGGCQHLWIIEVPATSSVGETN